MNHPNSARSQPFRSAPEPEPVEQAAGAAAPSDSIILASTEAHELVAAIAVRPDFSPAQVQQLSPAALAYLGDAVYELHIRTWLLWPPQRPHDYHQGVVARVKSTYQAQVADRWMARLTEEERDWWRRGRNSAVRRSNRVSHATYQAATGLETLVGYLYLTNPQRLHDLLCDLPPLGEPPSSPAPTP